MLKLLEYPKGMLQNCPLCGESQPIYIKGTVRDLEDHLVSAVVPDKGYSFCNCKNVWFTNWKNIDQGIYDSDYASRYNYEAVEKVFASYARSYFPILKRLNKVKTFLEIGSINDGMLKKAKEEGWEVTGSDITQRESEFPFIEIDLDLGIPGNKQYDVIWLSHIVEHLRKPIQDMEDVYKHVSEGGFVFVAMPDPFFIDHENVYSWVHWHVNEHHILWDMESFVEEMEKIGFRCVESVRNISSEFICNGDYHLVFQK